MLMRTRSRDYLEIRLYVPWEKQCIAAAKSIGILACAIRFELHPSPFEEA